MRKILMGLAVIVAVGVGFSTDERRLVPGLVTPAGRLDFDGVGALVRQQFSAECPGRRVGEL